MIKSVIQKRLTSIIKKLFLLNICLLSYFSYSDKKKLFNAVKFGDYITVSSALESGVDINVIDIEGWTLLHHAVYADQPRILKLLIAAGANVDVKNHRGQTPLSLVRGEIKSFFNWDRLYSIKILKAAKNKKKKQKLLNELIFNKVKWSFNTIDSMWLIKLAIRNGADPNAQDINGMTLLHYFAYNGDLEGVKFLVEEGGKWEIVSSKYENRQTPLDLAKEQGHQSIVDFLESQRSTSHCQKSFSSKV